MYAVRRARSGNTMIRKVCCRRPNYYCDNLSILKGNSGGTRTLSYSKSDHSPKSSSSALIIVPPKRSRVGSTLLSHPSFKPCWTDYSGLFNGVILPSSSWTIQDRYLHSSPSVGGDKEPLKPSSKVEESVIAIKEEKDSAVVKPEKRSLWKKIEDEILHYYHGFRLLFIDIRIAIGLINQVLNGKTLTRREHRQLIRTTSDVFRLVPFSVFVIVPFMELLLPVFLKFFPGMLPSTFQTKNEKENKMKAELKVKLEMAKFLQQTLDDMAVAGKGRSSQRAKEFSEFISKIRTSGGEVSNEDILKYSKLFEDEITLDSLSRQQLTALCHVLEISTLGTTAFLRFQLRMKLRSLAADDRTIEKEGVDALSVAELQQACKARGMRALGVSEGRLRRQLKSWLELSLHQKVPPSLLLLSRAMYLPENLPPSAQLQATISALPDAAAVQAKAAIGEREGKVDNKTRIEIIKEEERKIQEEKEELLADVESKKKILDDKDELLEEIIDAPVVTQATEGQDAAEKKADKALKVELLPNLNALLGPEILRQSTAKTVQETIERRLTKHVPHPLADSQKDPLTAEDLERIESALDVLGAQKRELYIETEELQDLKEELAEYQEDVMDLDTISKESKVAESKSARRLYKRLNKMIEKLEDTVNILQKDDPDAKQEVKDVELKEVVEGTDSKAAKLVSLQELIGAIENVQNVSDPARMERIADVLENLDEDGDGKLKVEDVLKVIELIGRENVQLSSNQVADIVSILEKEESLASGKQKPKSDKLISEKDKE